SINGKARELDWLRNMGDWMISKKRFWGLALPVWVCESCGSFDVIGSRAELKERAVEGWDRFEGHSPHRPWVDLVKVKCAQCGGKASRIPDVGNPWLDAGIVPYSTMGYNRDRAYWEKWFPADFITECFPGQFRNWFYAILAMSTMMEQRPPFKVLLGHGLVRDQWDRPMHKSSGNAIPFEGAADEGYLLTDPKGNTGRYPAMSADLIRWLFCRHNSALNLDFGPKPAEELRARFVLKLWNTYAFFCNYARIPPKRGGFDTAAPQVPVKGRPDIDRWILSELQKLVQTARQAFESFNVQAFCLEAERFVDRDLSNWYVRRNRDRFWGSEPGQDKLAAYQTLHEVLVTLTKLIAPVMPFLAESMYQNLTRGLPAHKASVHHCAYPEVSQALVDEELSRDMDALLDLVSLGSAARNTVKIKVRQPLAELVVSSEDDRCRRALERFAEQLSEELNVKRVTFRYDPEAWPLVQPVLQANAKALGPRIGGRLKEVQTALARLSAHPSSQLSLAAIKVVAGQPFDLATASGPVTLEPTDVVIDYRAPEGWAGVVEGGTEVLVDTRITEALRLEGMAREVVRHVQQARKDAGLEMEDRIILYLYTEAPDLSKAIETHRDYIAAETLVAEWASQPLGAGAHRANVKVDGQLLTIELRKLVAR
ncbi:MAG: DUF5915 domain-containing protein, partial [Gemmataceae bacterium]|nr:DUF5915 domain-containing protein [Gemmataceae bacterium]